MANNTWLRRTSGTEGVVDGNIVDFVNAFLQPHDHILFRRAVLKNFWTSDQVLKIARATKFFSTREERLKAKVDQFSGIKKAKITPLHLFEMGLAKIIQLDGEVAKPLMHAYNVAVNLAFTQHQGLILPEVEGLCREVVDERRKKMGVAFEIKVIGGKTTFDDLTTPQKQTRLEITFTKAK